MGGREIPIQGDQRGCVPAFPKPHETAVLMCAVCLSTETVSSLRTLPASLTQPRHQASSRREFPGPNYLQPVSQQGNRGGGPAHPELLGLCLPRPSSGPLHTQDSTQPLPLGPQVGGDACGPLCMRWRDLAHCCEALAVFTPAGLPGSRLTLPPAPGFSTHKPDGGSDCHDDSEPGTVHSRGARPCPRRPPLREMSLGPFDG